MSMRQLALTYGIIRPLVIHANIFISLALLKGSQRQSFPVEETPTLVLGEIFI